MGWISKAIPPLCKERLANFLYLPLFSSFRWLYICRLILISLGFRTGFNAKDRKKKMYQPPTWSAGARPPRY